MISKPCPPRSELDALVAASIAVFNQMTPEQQQQLMEEQRESFARSAVRDAERRRLEANPCRNVNLGPALTAEALLVALDRFTLHVQMRDVEPRTDDKWLLIDTKTADPDTNWPGELMSEHRTYHEARVALMNAAILTASPPDFQARCQDWLARVCEGDATDIDERVARFAEEGMELVQSLGMTFMQLVQLAIYVWGRPPGEPRQEFGGAYTTMAVLAEYTGHDLQGCGEQELARCWDPKVIEKIRGKRSRRHGRGPLPGTTEADLVPSDPATVHRQLGEIGEQMGSRGPLRARLPAGDCRCGRGGFGCCEDT